MQFLLQKIDVIANGTLTNVGEVRNTNAGGWKRGVKKIEYFIFCRTNF